LRNVRNHDLHTHSFLPVVLRTVRIQRVFYSLISATDFKEWVNGNSVLQELMIQYPIRHMSYTCTAQVIHPITAYTTLAAGVNVVGHYSPIRHCSPPPLLLPYKQEEIYMENLVHKAIHKQQQRYSKRKKINTLNFNSDTVTMCREMNTTHDARRTTHERHGSNLGRG
jgi:hypothetical protein